MFGLPRFMNELRQTAVCGKGKRNGGAHNQQKHTKKVASTKDVSRSDKTMFGLPTEHDKCLEQILAGIIVKEVAIAIYYSCLKTPFIMLTPRHREAPKPRSTRARPPSFRGCIAPPGPTQTATGNLMAG